MSGPATVFTVVPSPVGDLTLTGTGDALTGCWFEGHTKPTDHSPDLRADPGPFAAAVEQLEAYFAGELRRFDLVLEPSGSPFQHRVWEQLRAIPYGETRSYGQLATALGDPGLSRAVGTANGRNPLSIIVPCHRVIGADGSLTGFGGGLPRKRLLLDLESGARELFPA
ncbi:methylated-DNA--[protein]-cysteine S-methyltransferase [Aquihabitans sp. G128]|uniref:methylated-DNA--[protein]-cysteine S-methyltransferase n=1 Tax=Aquihabitans sp. G128 TaxID=2849779 RepID=UPI001C24DA2C|nr:methylated-DNA--[protein]-cysteine S-methyltransferase [Aquihabitans sp. G128]QXC60816.1 methylated-DNA--[protein]-cysteine S-methyltransferase [Aquihabitans sp. G128]